MRVRVRVRVRVRESTNLMCFVVFFFIPVVLSAQMIRSTEISPVSRISPMIFSTEEDDRRATLVTSERGNPDPKP